MAACVNRAPEGTFGCAVAEVGVHDMLKVGHGFLSSTPLTNRYFVLVPQIYDR